jgi:predicted phosphodiesterase
VPAELTTVADDAAVVHDGTTVHRFDGLAPDTDYTFEGIESRTLPRPPGELLCRFGTVNDVHFGERECGRIGESPLGPIVRTPPGHEPYWATMNQAAVLELAAASLDAVIVKGDLTNDGRAEDFERFRACYGTFGDRLHVIRGNHDAATGRSDYAGDAIVDLPGVRLVLVDTARTGRAGGWLDGDQLEFIADATEGDRPALVFGHHHPYLGARRPDQHEYFGIQPGPSAALVDVIARCPAIRGYFAGHTHRNRVRVHPATGAVPFVEVACVKDFPGSWAEYRVFDGGMLQIHHRLSSVSALTWSEQCRGLYRDFGVDYVAYAFGRLADRCFSFGIR